MRATATALAALAVLGVACSLARAQGYPPNCTYRYAPDACNSGFYAPNGCGCLAGPNYCLRPPFPPFNGLLPIPQQYANGAAPARMPQGPYGPPPGPGMGIPAFPMHRFAHGPRDFFMWGQQNPEVY